MKARVVPFTSSSSRQPGLSQQWRRLRSIFLTLSDDDRALLLRGAERLQWTTTRPTAEEPRKWLGAHEERRRVSAEAKQESAAEPRRSWLTDADIARIDRLMGKRPEGGGGA